MKFLGKWGASLNKKQHLHSVDLKENDSEWMAKYRHFSLFHQFIWIFFRKLLAKPTHECGYAETKRLFIDIRGWSNFSAIFFASALTGEGVQPIRNYLKVLDDFTIKSLIFSQWPRKENGEWIRMQSRQRHHKYTICLMFHWNRFHLHFFKAFFQAICVESVRAALLDTLPGDIAYNLRPKVSEWTQDGEVFLFGHFKNFYMI